MNQKEIAELRRRFRPDKSNITHIHGCLVNEQKEIVSKFCQPISMMREEEAEKFLAVLKRTLSGTPGKNVIDISFATSQVVDSEEHRLLMALRTSSLEDEEAVNTLYEKAAASLSIEGKYLILLAHDRYDVRYRPTDGASMEDASEEVFSYILCSVCPIKETKPALGYSAAENEFHTCTSNWLVGAPETGFLFPAFDDRQTNLYGAAYYTRSSAESHQAFADAIFHQELPMPADEQKETFETVLAESLESECSYEVIQGVHEKIAEVVEEYKARKEEEPLTLSKQEVCSILGSCGVSDAHAEVFAEKYDEEFGEETALPPQNLINPRQFEVRTPEVTIRVNPERTDLVETRVIDGVKYILIRADSGVEVNGVSIHIS